MFELPPSIFSVIRIVDPQRFKPPLGIAALAFRVDEVALQPANKDGRKSFLEYFV